MNSIDNSVNFRRLQIEDLIWIFSIGLAILIIVSNYYERLYLKSNDIKFRYYSLAINVLIIIVVLLFYIYFFILNYKDFNSTHKKEYYLGEISNILFIIGLFILLYVNVKAFNFTT